MLQKESIKKMKPENRKLFFRSQRMYKKDDLLKVRKSKSRATFYTAIFLVGGLIGMIFPDNGLFGSATIFLSSVPAIMVFSYSSKEQELENEINELTRIENEIISEEKENIENEKAKEKIEKIELDNKVNSNVKKSELDKKLLNISRKSVLLELCKNNLEKFNDLYEKNMLFDYLKMNNYTDEDANYLISEMEDIRTTEKAYKMKLDKWE